jgi:hypothetical protein
MLPIFRTISVGGVLLAIAILALALTPPGLSRMRVAAIDAPATGALIDRNKHPEWRQFIIQAALRRADALSALRDLPNRAMPLPQIPDVAPTYEAPVFPKLSTGEKEKVAGLPGQEGGDPDDITGAIKAAPATIPIDIGETSSTELPAFSADDKPPASRMPLSETPVAKVSAIEPAQPRKRPEAPRKKTVPHRRAAAPKPEASTQTVSPMPPPFNLLQAIFQSFSNQPAAGKPAMGGGAPVKSRGNAKPAKPIQAVAQ